VIVLASQRRSISAASIGVNGSARGSAFFEFARRSVIRLLDLAPSFPLLIDFLILDHHGSALALARDTGLGFTTINRWWHGHVSKITHEAIRKFCSTQGLNEDRVRALLRHDEDLYLRGKKIPVPDFSNVRSGPLSAQKKRELVYRREMRDTLARGSGAAAPTGRAESLTLVS